MKTFQLGEDSEFKTVAIADGYFYASKIANDTVESMQQQSTNQILKMAVDDIKKAKFEKDDEDLEIRFKSSIKSMPFNFANAADIPHFLAPLKESPEFNYAETQMGVFEAIKNHLIILAVAWAFVGFAYQISTGDGPTSGRRKLGFLIFIVRFIQDNLGNVGLYIVLALVALLPVWLLYSRIKNKPAKVEITHK